MALSEDDLFRWESQYATCNLLKSVNVPGGYVPGPLLWNHIFGPVKRETEDSVKDRRKVSSMERCGEILRSLAQFCDETEVEGPHLGRDPFGIEGFEGALRCVHSEGSSFQFNSGAVTRRCLHVAGVICLSAYFLCLGDTVVSNIKGAPVIVEKWEWNGDSGLKKLNDWKKYFSGTGRGAPDAENAMKLLYQWTLLPILALLDRVRREVMEEEHSVKFHLESKRSDEYCKFLIRYRELFEPSKDTEFLYSGEIYKFLRRTAQLYIKMGKTSEATDLLKEVKAMLAGVRENKRTITDWGEGKLINYVLPKHVDVVSREMEVGNLLINAAGGDLKLRQNRSEDRVDFWYDLEEENVSRPKVCCYLDWNASLYPEQIYRIFSAFGFPERLNEAREVWEQVQDLNDENLNARFREFLHSAVIGDLICHSCSPDSVLEWESIRRKQDFLLDVCEALGDLQLTANCLLCCASMMFERAVIDRLRPVIEHAKTSEPKLLSEEELNCVWRRELNLQLSPPAPESVQQLISCLNDPWKPGEHVRDNLPDTLKAIRFTKRSLDIYSDLLRKDWAEVTFDEDAWLKLLESQEGAQNLMVHFHLQIVDLCLKAALGLMTCSSDFSDARQRQRHLEALWLEPTENVRKDPSCCDVLQKALDALLTSTLVWMERGRARTLMKQLGRGDGAYPGSLKEELNEFDDNYEAAQSMILSCQSACRGDTVFIEYRTQVSTPGVKEYEFTQAVVIFGLHKLFLTLNVRSGLDQMEDIMQDVDGFCNEIEKISKDLSKCELESDRLELLKDGGAEKKLHCILEKLYDKLMQPILTNHALVEHLEPNATLIIVPDKALYRVPFALLRDKTTQKHLFQLHKIAVVPSLRVLPHCERRLRHLESLQLKPKCILAVGNPAFNERTTTLSGTAEELKTLRNCFGDERVETLEEGEATRANFLKLVKEADASSEKDALAVIHLGVHGFWNKFKLGDNEREIKFKTGSLQFAKPPLHSRVFTEPSSDVGIADDLMIGYIGSTQRPGAQLQTFKDPVTEQDFKSEAKISVDDHRLSAEDQEMLSSEDIVKGGFQWPTRLAVLSACNSSRGQSYTDGEVNLPRALMIKGVPAAVVSQWKVPDKTSPMLMKELYENLQYGQDVVTAMQSAMIQVSGDPTSSICDWGSFLVWGLPTVQLPLELCTKKAQRTHPTRQHAMALKSEARRLVPGKLKEALFDMLRAVDNFLDAATKPSAFDKKLLTDAIVMLWRIEIEPLNPVDVARGDQLLAENISKETRALSEAFYDLILEEFTGVERELETSRCDPQCMISFWGHVKYKQAMRGNYEIALECCNKIREMYQKIYQRPVRYLDTAVILRLMGRHEEALEEFDLYLASCDEDYECLMQASYLKHLMEDENGALVFALRAKKLVAAKSTSWDVLANTPLPDGFQQWLSNVDESSWTPAVASRDQVIVLSWRLRSCKDEAARISYLKDMKAVDTFLASVYNECALNDISVIIDAILAVDRLLDRLNKNRYFSEDVIAMTEELYTRIPLQQSGAEIELTLEREQSITAKMNFWLRLMFVQAMKGNHGRALMLADNLMEVVQNADGCGYDEQTVMIIKSFEDFVKLERAVVLRLLQDYDQAYEVLHRLIAECGDKDYACLIEMSYLQTLRGNQSEALEYARQAKTCESADMNSPGFGAFQLAIRALPHEHRQWLLNATAEDAATGV